MDQSSGPLWGNLFSGLAEAAAITWNCSYVGYPTFKVWHVVAIFVETFVRGLSAVNAKLMAANAETPPILDKTKLARCAIPWLIPHFIDHPVPYGGNCHAPRTGIAARQMTMTVTTRVHHLKPVDPHFMARSPEEKVAARAD